MSNTTSEPFLTEDQVSSFQKNGYLVLPNTASKEQIQQLRQRIHDLITNMFDNDFKSHKASIFTSAQDDDHVQGNYFLESSDKIGFFLEKQAFDEETQKIKDGVSKYHAINKMGHALHDKDEVFKDFSFQQKFATIAKQLLNYQEPTIAQSMYIFKSPKIGGKVTPHQDSTFLYTKQRPVIGLWFALEDADKHNGCLWGIPGSHNKGLIYQWLRDENDKLSFVKHDTDADETIVKEDAHQDEYVPIEVPAGTCVILHGRFVHKSFENTSPDGREAFTLHVIDKQDTYPKENWLQRKDNFPAYWH